MVENGRTDELKRGEEGEKEGYKRGKNDGVVKGPA